MNPNMKAMLKKAGEWVGLLAVFGVAGTYWINTEVERRMNELAIDPSAAPAVVTLQAEVANIEASQVRIERKVDDFSGKFLEYLERQAQ